MKRLIKWLESINYWVGSGVRWLALCMVIIQFFVVILRHALGYNHVAVNESVLYLHGMLFMLGAGYTLLIDGHVRVDIFYAKLSSRAQAVIDNLGHVFLLIPAMLALLYWSWPSVYSAWKIKEGTISSGGIPGIWVLKLLIPTFCLLLLVQSVACLLKNTLLIFNIDSSRK